MAHSSKTTEITTIAGIESGKVRKQQIFNGCSTNAERKQIK